MIRRLVLAAPLLVLAAPALAAVPTPGAPQSRAIAIVGATVHPVSGADIPNGTVVFDHGKIVAVGAAGAVTVPAGAEIVEGAGKHVYPSLIDPWTTIGLTEIDANRATRDYAETASLAPNVRADQAFQPESELIPVARSNGILLANVTPRGGVLSGQASLMALDGWTNVDMTVRTPIGMVVNWPGMVIVRSDGGPPEAVQRDNRDRALRSLAQAFDDAAAYRSAKGDGRVHDRRWEALVPVLEGRLPLLVQAEEVHQIEAAVAFAAERKLKLVIYGGYDAPLVTDLLKAHDVPVIVSSIQRLPRRRGDPYDAPFTVPARLQAAGVRFAIGNGGGSWNERNLPYQAATAQAFGLSAEDALKAITLYPAQILGVADRVGALATGLDATLIVTDGDILDTPSHVLEAWAFGRAVDLNDKQKTLNAKYQEKYRRLGLLPAASPSQP
jgi:imidazolonepropionase-like amidohydrolase